MEHSSVVRLHPPCHSALHNELLQHQLSSRAEQWYAHHTGYVIGGDGDDHEVRDTFLSHLCWVDSMWLFASDATTLQTMIGDCDPPRAQRPGNALETQESPDHVLLHTCPENHRCEVTTRALEGHRLSFDPWRSMKVLGSWCDDCGGSSGALLAYLQAGNGAFFRHAELLRVSTLTLAGRARTFGTTCTSSALHGQETLRLDSSGLRRLKGWEGRWLRSTRRSRKGNWETHQHDVKRTGTPWTSTRGMTSKWHT